MGGSFILHNCVVCLFPILDKCVEYQQIQKKYKFPMVCMVWYGNCPFQGLYTLNWGDFLWQGTMIGMAGQRIGMAEPPKSRNTNDKQMKSKWHYIHNEVYMFHSSQFKLNSKRNLKSLDFPMAERHTD